MNTKRKTKAHAKLTAKRIKAIREIEKCLQETIIRGSIREHGNICGTPGCRCKRKKDPILHGPYRYLSFRGSQSNHSIMISGVREEKVTEGINNYKRIMQAIKTISDIDFSTIRYYQKIEDSR